ncbi:SID1 transmembrane family member 1-like isoform X2 [Oratosquilla oratoria]|uniref:SID1 transmembrane family member 1-like isoform X2 n=1 Tax=Oratosquilla oratoria TaxID=337810 RepID=UPI003F7675A6
MTLKAKWLVGRDAPRLLPYVFLFVVISEIGIFKVQSLQGPFVIVNYEEPPKSTNSSSDVYAPRATGPLVLDSKPSASIESGLHQLSLRDGTLQDDKFRDGTPRGVKIRSRKSRRTAIEDRINCTVVNGDIGEAETLTVNRNEEYIIEYVYNTSDVKEKALRVSAISENSNYMYPVLVVVRQQQGILSWQLPLEPPPNMETMEEYTVVSRTLCPVKNYRVNYHTSLENTQRLFVDVSSSSPHNLNFTIEVDLIDNFHVTLHNERYFEITPSEPAFYEFHFPDDVDMVLVKASSEDDFCSVISIQNISCPVFDTEENVKYGNVYQTMTYQAGITLRREQYPEGLYIVSILLSNDEPCSSSFQHVYRKRSKIISLTVEEKITRLEYLAAIFAGLGFCAFFYIVTVILACISFIKEKHKDTPDSRLLDDTILNFPEEERGSPTCNYGAVASTSVGVAGEAKTAPAPSLTRTTSDSSLDEDDIDMLDDVESDKDIIRTKTYPYVSDLARKNTRVLSKKSYLYIWGLITVAIFYAVPVVQLVVTNQQVLDASGNQDLCFYNFWCAHPLGPLSDFNHVFSNISYILFGGLFIVVCIRRDRQHRKKTRMNYKIDKYFGIPQHFGLFYAMGGALTMEGLLSGCYHICPNYSNFQFDTAFMYVIAVLCMLKIYQTRHPDINASASSAYATLAVAILLGVIGVLNGTLYFWILFGFFHVLACLFMSAHIYYMGRWSLDVGLFTRMIAWCKSEVSDCHSILKPMYCDRMILLLIGNAANWGLAIFGMITTPKDFASYLLNIFLTNLLLYMTFYLIMKLLLTLDDDLMYTPRDKIPVF